MNSHQESIFRPLDNFFPTPPAVLLKGQKLNFANHLYLCKDLIIFKISKK
ncbi:hypothetical protein THERMOT_2199 [Bathymodiolus thermophilus thioautotrophic gill symbiont]|nr:hypothetical protein THERMOT_2199 [Bathymodiolus thermophilus thioautotrophic gill symbiont]